MYTNHTIGIRLFYFQKITMRNNMHQYGYFWHIIYDGFKTNPLNIKRSHHSLAMKAFHTLTYCRLNSTILIFSIEKTAYMYMYTIF